MHYDRKKLVLTCLATMVGGTLLHFVHDWLPNPVTALFSPINESLWEHVKIIFWPVLAGGIWMSRGRPGALRPWLLVLPLLCTAMLGVGWLYHVSLGQDQMWVDILLFILLIAAGFYLPTRFSGPFTGQRWLIASVLSSALALIIFLFTFFPPDHLLFRDLSQQPSWMVMDC